MFIHLGGRGGTCRQTVKINNRLDDWDDVWSTTFSKLVSARDHLIQYKFFHRIYFTPAKLARIFHTHSSAPRAVVPLLGQILYTYFGNVHPFNCSGLRL